jgi:hypothetical protein
MIAPKSFPRSALSNEGYNFKNCGIPEKTNESFFSVSKESQRVNRVSEEKTKPQTKSVGI